MIDDDAHLRVEVDTGASPPVISARGELDVSSSGELAAALVTVAPSPAGIHLDLSEVTFIDSSGLRVIAATMRDGDEHGGPVRVIAASEAVRRIVELTGMGEMLALPD